MIDESMIHESITYNLTNTIIRFVVLAGLILSAISLLISVLMYLDARGYEQANALLRMFISSAIFLSFIPGAILLAILDAVVANNKLVRKAN